MMESWELVKLGDLAEINPRSLREDTDDTYSFKYIDLSLVKEGVINYPEREILFGEASPRARRIVQKSDILLSTVRPNLRGYGIIENSIEDHICSTGFAVVRCASEITAKYIYQYLFCESFERQIHALVVGSNYPAINTNDVASLKFLLPPLAEQERIVEILSDADASIAALQRQEELFSTLQTATLTKIFRKYVNSSSDASTNLPLMRLGEVLVERNEKGHEYLPLASITMAKGVIPRDEVGRKDSSSEDKSKYKRISTGDIGYNTMRMWQGVSGLSAIEAIVSPAYTVCIPNTQTINPRWVALLFKEPRMVFEFWRFSQGLVNDTLGLKFPVLSEIKFRCPDLEQQIADVIAMDAALSHLTSLHQQIVTLKKQKRGLMQKMLGGNLGLAGKGQ